MKYYISLKQDENCDQTVHNEKCKKLPPMEDLAYVGDFTFRRSAMKAAEKRFKQINGCQFCTRSYYHIDAD